MLTTARLIIDCYDMLIIAAYSASLSSPSKCSEFSGYNVFIFVILSSCLSVHSSMASRWQWHHFIVTTDSFKMVKAVDFKFDMHVPRDSPHKTP